MKTIEEIIGENIRERRKALGMTQTQLGEAVDLTVQAVSKIEKGRRSARKANLESIARALGCSREQLMPKKEAADPGAELKRLIDMWFESSGDIRRRVLKFLEREIASEGATSSKVNDV